MEREESSHNLATRQARDDGDALTAWFSRHTLQCIQRDDSFRSVTCQCTAHAGMRRKLLPVKRVNFGAVIAQPVWRHYLTTCAFVSIRGENDSPQRHGGAALIAAASDGDSAGWKLPGRATASPACTTVRCCRTAYPSRGAQLHRLPSGGGAVDRSERIECPSPA